MELHSFSLILSFIVFIFKHVSIQLYVGLNLFKVFRCSGVQNDVCAPQTCGQITQLLTISRDFLMIILNLRIRKEKKHTFPILFKITHFDNTL